MVAFKPADYALFTFTVTQMNARIAPLQVPGKGVAQERPTKTMCEQLKMKILNSQSRLLWKKSAS